MPVSKATSPTAKVAFPQASVPEAPVAPDRADQPERHRHEEHQPPFDRRQYPAEDEAEERAAHRAHPVDPHGPAPLAGREGIGDDGTGVSEQ